MPDSTLFAIDLVTPERVLIDGLATEVVLRTAEGDITFLAGHAPLVGTVEPGVVRVVRAEGDEERVATHGGFVQVDQDRAEREDPAESTSGTRVTLLIGVAELGEEIDVGRARAAFEAAEARVAELAASGARGAGAAEEEADPEVVAAEAARRRAEVRIEAVDAGASTVPSGTS